MFVKVVVPIRRFAGRRRRRFLQMLSYHRPNFEWEFLHVSSTNDDERYKEENACLPSYPSLS